ncbi:MAG: AmmeMemoRadiSam system protein B [Syntrophobacterales bacterium]|nr:MAG: AmmeMemoRadiSam system protein B [Syntrophobacterales bacterium]
MDFPKLRSINAFPTQVQGQQVICIQDPQGFSQRALFLPPPLFFIVSLFDGKHSILDIQAEYMRKYGELIYREKIEEVIDQLDAQLLLDSELFRDALEREKRDFRVSRVREATFAGTSYNPDPLTLRGQVEGYFAPPDGPGKPRMENPSGALKGIIAPHIDFQRGGPCYAFAHKEVREASHADLFVILGTAHCEMKNYFSLTLKDFRTPFGTAKTNKAFVEALSKACDWDSFEDEFVHKREHSIEFQLIFLQFIYPSKPIEIVPILCRSFHEAIERSISPRDIPQIGIFIEALKKTVRSIDREVCLIASADLAHIGLQFGDGDPASSMLNETRVRDLEMLAYAEKVDAEGFYDSIRKEGDRRRICGFPCIYVLLNINGIKKGRLLKYAQSQNQGNQSAVTFASLAFY